MMIPRSLVNFFIHGRDTIKTSLPPWVYIHFLLEVAHFTPLSLNGSESPGVMDRTKIQ